MLRPASSPRTAVETAYHCEGNEFSTAQYKPLPQHFPVPWFCQTRRPTPGSCFPGSQAPALLATLTVYNEGLNTTNWEVTAPSATGTPNVIHCGPGWTLNGGEGGSVCTATYPVGSYVTLTAPANAGAFGGWSYNCLADPDNYCEGTQQLARSSLATNDTVGAIFN